MPTSRIFMASGGSPTLGPCAAAGPDITVIATLVINTSRTRIRIMAPSQARPRRTFGRPARIVPRRVLPAQIGRNTTLLAFDACALNHLRPLLDVGSQPRIDLGRRAGPGVDAELERAPFQLGF